MFFIVSAVSSTFPTLMLLVKYHDVVISEEEATPVENRSGVFVYDDWTEPECLPLLRIH